MVVLLISPIEVDVEEAVNTINQSELHKKAYKALRNYQNGLNDIYMRIYFHMPESEKTLPEMSEFIGEDNLHELEKCLYDLVNVSVLGWVSSISEPVKYDIRIVPALLMKKHSRKDIEYADFMKEIDKYIVKNEPELLRYLNS